MERSHVFLGRRSESSFRGRSGTTAAGSTGHEKLQLGDAMSDVLRTGSSGSGCLQEPIRRGLLDRLGRSSNPYEANNHFGGGKSYAPVGLGYAEDQDDAVGESDSRSFKEGNVANSRFRC